jgi:hypothetical protein
LATSQNEAESEINSFGWRRGVITNMTSKKIFVSSLLNTLFIDEYCMINFDETLHPD